MQFVPVNQITLVILHNVDQNVSLVQIALRTRLASIKNAKIHVQGLVAKMLIVRSSIIIRCAVALLDTPEIHSLDVLKNVRFLFSCYLL